MTENERNRFHAILMAKVAELERFNRHREKSRLREAPISWKRFRRLQNAHLRFVISTANLTNFETPVRRSVVSRKGALGPASSAMKISTRSGLPRCRGPHTVYGARKP
jgi:hypothetical protein